MAQGTQASTKPVSYQTIGPTGHEESVYAGRLEGIKILIFNGPYYGYTLPSGWSSTYPYNRMLLLAGQGKSRYLAHIEGSLHPDSIYIHINGGETKIPTDGTYNVYGTLLYV